MPGRRDLWHQFLAQQGYVVASIDNRGTNTPRGQVWRKSIYGQLESWQHDQAAAASKLFQMFPTSIRAGRDLGMEWWWPDDHELPVPVSQDL